MAKTVLVFRPGASVHRDAAVLWDRDAPGGDVCAKAGVERTTGGAGPLRCGLDWLLCLRLPHVCDRHEPLRAPAVRSAGGVFGSASGVFAGELAGDTVGWASAVHGVDALCDRLHFAIHRRRTFRNISGTARSGNSGGERRLCDRALPPGDGRGGNVRDSGGAVFLVSKTVWLPDEREARQSAFLADVRGGLLHFYADALAWAVDAIESAGRRATAGAGIGGRFDSNSGDGSDDLDRGGAVAVYYQFFWQPGSRQKIGSKQPLARRDARMEYRLVLAGREFCRGGSGSLPWGVRLRRERL